MASLTSRPSSAHERALARFADACTAENGTNAAVVAAARVA